MNKRRAFTIVELLTSIVIIVLLLGILLPSITMVRRMAKETAQKAQFTTIEAALEAFKQDYGDYPPSNWQDGVATPQVYCGAQKLTEALLGWDLMGFDPNTAWRRDGLDNITPTGNGSYDPARTRVRPDGQYYTLFERRGPYLDVAKTPVFRLGTSGAAASDGLYDSTLTVFSQAFNTTVPNYVICDVFGVKKLTIPTAGTTTVTATAGSPIIYYRANTSNKILSCLGAQIANSIYDYRDNYALLQLGILPNGGQHQIMQPPTGTYFCSPDYKIVDGKVPPFSQGVYWPKRPDTYILISAGADHNFGTNDDILNF